MLRQFVQVLRDPVLLLCAATLAALLTLADAAGLAGLWLAVLLACAVARYPYAITRSAAAGERELPPSALEDFNPAGEPAILAHAGLLFALAAASVRLLDGSWSLGAIVVLCAVAPVSIAVMAMTASLQSAVNPVELSRVLIILGEDYLWLLVFLVGLYALARVAGSVIGLAPVERFASIYVLLAGFAAIGRLLHQRRFDLDFVPLSAADRREYRDRVEAAAAMGAAMDRVYALLRSGATERAWAAVNEVLAGENDGLETWEAVYERLRSWRMQPHTSAFAREFVTALLEQGQTQRALEVTEERLRQDCDFRLPMPLVAPVAAQAERIGHRETAAALRSLHDAGDEAG